MTSARSASVTNLFTQNCPDRSKRAKIIPMIQEPELADEARAVYNLWTAKDDKVQF